MRFLYKIYSNYDGFTPRRIPARMRDGGEIERAVTAFARSPNGGLIVLGTSWGGGLYGDLMVMLAARHRLPAVYPFRHFVTGGGLISYGPDSHDHY